jgi:hypothetical protein
MKKGLKLRWCLAAVLLFLYTSCAKHHDTPTADCITRVYTSQASTVSASQLDSINALFSLNGLSTAGLQFYFFLVDTVALPGYTGTQEEAAAYLFYNGLPVFDGSATYIFDTGIFQQAASFAYHGAAPGPDTTSHQTLEDLRTTWLTHYQQDTIFGGALNSRPTAPGTAYRDSCLVAELGYIDAATFSNGTVPYGASLVKVWKVSPSSNNNYPIVYVQDSTGICIPVKEFLP